MTADPQAPAGPAAPRPRDATRDLRPWVIIAIILGAVGVLLGASNVVSPLLQNREDATRMAEAAGRWTEKVGPAKSDGQRRVQADYTARLIDAQWDLRPWRVLTGAVDLVLSAGLVIGGILLLKRKEAGRKLVRAAAWGHVPYEAVSMAIGVVGALRAAALQTELVTTIMDAAPGEHDEVAKRIATTTAAIGQYMSVAFVVALGIGVAVFCVVLAKMVDKPEIRAWCQA